MNTQKIHYSWIICLGCTLLLFCTGGLTATGFSTYQPYLVADKGLTNLQCSSISLVRSLFSLFAMLTIQPILNRLEVRRLVSLSMFVCAGAFFTYSISNTFYAYCIAAALSGLALGFGGMIPASIIITRWFIDHRGLALGICMAATGLSAFIASPVIALLIENFSLQTAFFIEACFIFCSAFAVYFILRSRPSCMNLEPLNSHTKSKLSYNQGNAGYADKTAQPLIIIMMCLGILLFGTAGNNLYSHISLLYRSSGVTGMHVSWLISLFGISLAIGKCMYGQLSDKLGFFRSSCIMYCLTLIGTVLSCLANFGNYSLDVLAVILMGLGLAVTSVSIPHYAQYTADQNDYPKILSRYQLMSTLGGLLFAAVPGFIADHYGSYIPAFMLMFILSLAGAVLSLTLYHIVHSQHAASDISLI